MKSLALVLAMTACATDPAVDSTDQALTAPSIAALSIKGAPSAGGSTVLIVGLDLDPAATVTYGGVAAGSVTGCSTTCTSAPYVGLVTTTPALPEGYVDLVVTNPDGSAATYPSFHIGPAPLVAGFSPLATRKGKDLTITGDFFAATPQVNIGGLIALPKSISATQIIVTVPKLNVGFYQLSVANPDGQYGVAPGTLAITD